jgi:imidazolonepropionase-like amidohydrolase
LKIVSCHPRQSRPDVSGWRHDDPRDRRRRVPGKPHDVLPYALRALVEQIGMTPLQALRAVTSIAASAMGLGGSKGRIAAGADADVVVVWGDPVADIGSVTDVEAVFRAGVRAR